METEKLNKKSLYQEGGDLNSPDSNALIESLSEEIQQRVKIGEPAEAILYSYLEQGVKQEQLALAFESVGYDPNAFVALMQSTEEMVNNEMQMQQQMQQMQNVENTQQAPQDIEQQPQQMMEEIPEGMIPPMQYGGDMFSNLFMFGDALNDAFRDTTNWENQKDQYEKGKRHRWEVDFKGADVNPKDYYVTSQGELRNFKDDKKNKNDEVSLFPSSIDIKGNEAIDYGEDDEPNIEFIPYPAKQVGSKNFNDWLSANKPKIKNLPFESPTELGPEGPIRNPSMLSIQKYGGDLPKAQIGIPGSMMPFVTPIPNQSFSNIEPMDLIEGQRFDTANANTFTNPMNTSNPIGPTGIPGGGSGHYYLGNIGPGSGMGAINLEQLNFNNSVNDMQTTDYSPDSELQNQQKFYANGPGSGMGNVNNEEITIENLRNEYNSSQQTNAKNSTFNTNDWQEGEDAGAWNQDPTVKRKRTIGTAMSNAENWLKNNPTSRAIGNVANIIKTGAGVVSSGLNAFNVMDAQAEQKRRMSADAIGGISQGNRGQQDLNTGLFIEDKDVYGMSKYGSELYKNGGNIKNWFEQNNIPRAQGGMEVEIDNDTLVALIAAGADIEML